MKTFSRREPVAPHASLTIHALAVVHPDAQLARGVEIGPFCVIGANARIGEGTKLLSNVIVNGQTTKLGFGLTLVGHSPAA